MVLAEKSEMESWNAVQLCSWKLSKREKRLLSNGMFQKFLLSMKSKLLDNTHVPSLEILFKKTDIALCSCALIFQGILQYCIFV